VSLIKQSSFIHLQCKHWQVGQGMTFFSAAASRLAACTGLGKRAGAESTRGMAVLLTSVHAEYCSPQAYFWPEYVPGTAPKGSLGVAAAGFAPSSTAAPSHPTPQGPEHPCAGCSNSPHPTWGDLNWKVHPKDTAWDPEETRGQWCLAGVLGEVV